MKTKSKYINPPFISNAPKMNIKASVRSTPAKYMPSGPTKDADMTTNECCGMHPAVMRGCK